jgi:hypothetical protein
MCLTFASSNEVVLRKTPSRLCAVLAGKAGRCKAEPDSGSTARLAQSVQRRAFSLVVIGWNRVLPIVGFAGALPGELPVIMQLDGAPIMEQVGGA